MEIADLIGNIGFPAIMCILMLNMFKYMLERFRENLEKVEMQHASDIESLKKALENNTNVMQKLIDKMGE